VFGMDFVTQTKRKRLRALMKLIVEEGRMASDGFGPKFIKSFFFFHVLLMRRPKLLTNNEQ